MSERQGKCGVVCRGIDGGNLLGFLAALGAFRVLSEAMERQGEEAVRMSWTDEFGPWSPVLWHSRLAGSDEMTKVLASELTGSRPEAAFGIGDNLTLTPDEFRRHLIAVAGQRESGKRRTAGFLTAFGSDLDTGADSIQDTAFRTMSGAGHQHFLAFMRKLHELTDEETLGRSLFAEWDYQDDRPSMRWDYQDYRPHALRAKDPAKDAIRTVRGANRLAVEALPLFPTAPASGGLRTAGFSRFDRDECITWAIWTPALELGTVRSLIVLRELQCSALSRARLKALGIAQAYRAMRFTEGKYRNFGAPRALL